MGQSADEFEDRIRALAGLTVQDPRQAARVLLAEGVPMRARTAGLLLVAVVSALLAKCPAGHPARGLDPFQRLHAGQPVPRRRCPMKLFLALTVVLIHRVGKAFGGRGSFPVSLIVVWLQLLTLALQLLQLVASLVVPPCR